MRGYTVAVFVISGLLLLGCIPSFHPLFTSEDVAFDPALVGTWTNEEGNETLRFTAAKKKSYRMVYTDKEGKAGAFEAHLVRIDGHTFLDLFPADADLPQSNFYKAHFVPAHTFLLVHEISPPRLRVAMVSPEWLNKYLKEHPDALKHERREGGQLLLTASTKQLQQFFAKHVKTPKAFGEPASLTRLEPTGQPAAEPEQKETAEKAEDSK
jgi:hypothetical protein